MTTPNEVTDGDLADFCQMLGIYGTHFKGGSIVKSALQKIVDKHAAKAQAEPDAWRIFNGARVRKRKGSERGGRIVGFYSVELIYPAAALELIPPAPDQGAKNAN